LEIAARYNGLLIPQTFVDTELATMIAAIRAHVRNTLFLNTYLLIIMRVFGAGTGFLFWALAARTASAEAVGLASGAVSAATLFAGLAQLGLGYGLVRHLGAADDPNGLLNLSIVLSGLAGLGLGLLFLATLPVWSPALLPLRADLLTSLIFVVLALSTTTTQLLHWAFLATRRLSLSLWKMSIQSVLAIVLLLVLRPWMSGYLAIVSAYMLSTVLGLALCFWPFLPIAQPGYRFSLRFKLLPRSSFANYSLVNYAADQFQRAPDTLLPLIVIQQFGADMGAYFFVVWTLGRSIAAWAGSIAESLFAEGAHDPAKVATHMWRSIKLGLLLAGGLTAVTMLFGRLILAVYGQEYIDQGVTLLYFVALSGIPAVLLSIYINFLRIKDRLRAVSVIMAVNVGCGMLLSVAIMQVSFVGSGLGWLVSQILVLAGAGVWWRRQQVAILPSMLATEEHYG
jgi:O-antigen/teichoic acid export membrane protein